MKPVKAVTVKDLRRGLAGGVIFALWALIVQAPPWPLVLLTFAGGFVFTIFITRQVKIFQRELSIGDKGSQETSENHAVSSFAEVTPRIVNEWAYLKVKNISDKQSNFSARVLHLTGVENEDLPYNALWAKEDDTERPEWQSLDPGNEAFLKVAHLGKGREPLSIARFYAADGDPLEGELKPHSTLELEVEVHSDQVEKDSCRSRFQLVLGGQGKWSSFKEA